LARATIINYVPFIRSFLQDCFGDAPVTLSHLGAHDVVGFVQRQAPRLHPKRAKLLASALRSFLRYVRYRGSTKLDLAAAVPVVANWSRSSIPRAIAADQVGQLLASIDRRTAIGRRDCAILLLLARLGLRSGEVAFLELGDIDWNAGQLSVHGKSGPRSELPLPAELAKRSPRICGVNGRTIPAGVSFCAPKRPSAAFKAPVAWDRSFDIASSAPAWRLPLTEPISFAMD